MNIKNHESFQITESFDVSGVPPSYRRLFTSFCELNTISRFQVKRYVNFMLTKQIIHNCHKKFLIKHIR